MKKTLIVQYTPRIDSNTKKLVDSFVEYAQDKTEITFLDLTKNTPDLLLEENLNLYVQRNFGGVELTEEQSQILAKNDEYVAQILAADYIVLATPMYNFTLPATVKAWFDAIVQAGVTFTKTTEGLKGLCENKEALLLMTSGTDFSIEPYSAVDFATPLVKTIFGLIGIPSQKVTAFGTQQYADKLTTFIENAEAKVKEAATNWYS